MTKSSDWDQRVFSSCNKLKQSLLCQCCYINVRGSESEPERVHGSAAKVPNDYLIVLWGTYGGNWPWNKFLLEEVTDCMSGHQAHAKLRCWLFMARGGFSQVHGNWADGSASQSTSVHHVDELLSQRLSLETDKILMITSLFRVILVAVTMEITMIFKVSSSAGLPEGTAGPYGPHGAPW